MKIVRFHTIVNAHKILNRLATLINYLWEKSFYFLRRQKFKITCGCFFCGFALISCEPRWDFGSMDFIPQIIVEGWIENNDFAHVCLSQSITLNSSIDSTSMFDVPIRWAKVTVSDGVDSEILTGRMDTRYTPPFLYTGSRLRGEAGKTYTLKVEYSGRTVTASTYIPAPVPLSRLTVTKCDDSDTLYQIKAYFTDNPAERNYYKFFTRVWTKDKRFFSSFMGTFDDEVLPEGEASCAVYRGFRYTDLKKYTPFYKEKDSVAIKFTQIPKEGFEFWSSYENEVTNGKNPLFPSSSNLKSNVKGGLGIWCGYGIHTYYISIKDSIYETKSF